MCILFIYDGSSDESSDFSLIVASNRDENYGRPTQLMAPWNEDSNVIGGRGKIVAEYVKSDTPVREYIDSIKSYVQDCNEFLFVAVELGKPLSICTYSNATNELTKHSDTCLGFGNSLPDTPLHKVQAGRSRLKDICSRYNKVFMKQELIKELVKLLKSKERHLPDPELEKRRPGMSHQLSSIFVCIPDKEYGTRTHTLILVTKTGHIDVIEVSMQLPIDAEKPNWHRTEFQFDS